VVEATGLAVGDDVVGRCSDEGAAVAAGEWRAVGGVGGRHRTRFGGRKEVVVKNSIQGGSGRSKTSRGGIVRNAE
jgi:hypothetical protein